MTTRAVVRHVRYWRGKVHRWSTVYQFVGTPSASLGTADAHTVLTADDAMCWGDGQAGFGGTYECQLYNQAVGGVPIATYVAFDWTTAASWIAHSGSGWGAISTQPDAVAESALQVEWVAGLSSSGKPVRLRKWYHAVPVTSGVGASAQFTSAEITSLTSAANAITGCLGSKGLTLGSSSGRLAGSALVLPYPGTHQMPRGRRRKALVTASGRYTGPSIQLPESGVLGGENQATD